ncbi:ABC transporter ATP-binding protein [Oleisolibacter albus]|uniref:ABC transporter ATP-binding protein n=1 Tax=Oleisolibacter albus TaxID=2171757 RepID=UPI000DF4852C|nr:ABC transporter ATP-binding protein [Oleisolibacter albus]
MSVSPSLPPSLRRGTDTAGVHSPQEMGSWTLLRRLVTAYLGPYRWRLGLALLLMATEAAANGSIAKAFERLLDDIFQPGNLSQLAPFATFVFLAFLLRGASAYLHQIIVNTVGQKVVAGIQKQVFSHILRSDMAYLQSHASGTLISRLINDVNQMRIAVSDCMTGFIRYALTLVALVTVMFIQDWVLACVAFVVFPIAGWVLSSLGGRLRRVAKRTQAEMGLLSALLTQTFQGARHVKAYGMEAHEEQRVNGTITRLRELTVKSFRISASLLPMNELFSGMAVVGVIVYGAYRISAGESTAGELVSFIGAFMLAYQPVNALSKLNAQLQTGLAAAERVLEVLDTKPTIVDAPGATVLPRRHHGVRFEQVRFSYDGGKGALNGIDLEIAPGRTVALVGSSGAGKSTVLNLIPRFYDVTGGRVLIDGIDVRDITLASLRDNMALVSQETALFDESIRANIAYGRPGASEAEIIQAARDAAAHDFIIGLPDGYDTKVGENGLRLSGGQRQRVAIARAMLKNAPILLLDEATSALDSESERAIQEALRRLQKGRTTLVIAHRLSTIIDADCIHVLEQGRVVESGSHADLLARGGAYARFYALQAGLEAVAP